MSEQLHLSPSLYLKNENWLDGKKYDLERNQITDNKGSKLPPPVTGNTTFLDSIFGGGMNALKPPYVIRVVNTAGLSTEVKELIHDFSSAIRETRVRRLARVGEDVVVSLEIERLGAGPAISARPLEAAIPD